MTDIDLFPRYLASQLRTQINATIVGKLTDINRKKGSFVLETDPQAKLSVEIIFSEHEQESSFAIGRFYEVRGVCKSGKEIEMRGFTSYGNEFDLASYNSMLQLATKQFREIFYP